jgi:DNA-binding CsgD family transcriptional regulator
LKTKEGGRQRMQEHIDFVLNKCPIGLLVFDRNMDIVSQNKKARLFLSRFELPSEVNAVSKRAFSAIDFGNLNELFPGEIHLTKKYEESPSNWIFRLYIYDKPNPLVYVLIIEETLSNKLNLNGIRQEFKLTRRETDMLRRVLDGLKNTDIAMDFDISEQTVKDHLSNIYMKTGAKNRFTLLRLMMDRPGT